MISWFVLGDFKVQIRLLYPSRCVKVGEEPGLKPPATDTLPTITFEETEARDFSGEIETPTQAVRSPTNRRRMPSRVSYPTSILCNVKKDCVLISK